MEEVTLQDAETSENKPARDEHGHLLPGHTANPNGRPKDTVLSRVQRELKKVEKEVIAEVKERKREEVFNLVANLEEEIRRAITSLPSKIDEAKYGDLASAIEKFTKLKELLTGGDTERVGGLSELTELFKKKADVHPIGDSQVVQERSRESTPLDERAD